MSESDNKADARKLADTVLQQEARIELLESTIQAQRNNLFEEKQKIEQLERRGTRDKAKFFGLSMGGLTGLSLIACLALYGCPQYNVWQKTLQGKAELKQAEWNRQIKIQEANAIQESSKALAKAEVERAKGVAQANQIIGDSLKNNESYLRYLYIQGLQDKDNNIIYVPTEAGLPILEAGKR